MVESSGEGIAGHPDYKQEVQHLDATIAAMRESIPELESAGYAVNAWDSEVDINAKRMVAKYKHRKADALRGALENPYFGRVDFVEDEIDLPETFYLGRTGFNGPEEFQVVDWRAPKATVFYESQGGRAAYAVRGEKYYGEVNLKRQYQINAGSLEKFWDDQVLSTLIAGAPGQHPPDAALLNRLQQGTAKLKDIVETIRGEQNVIIRQPLDQITVVQGCAGSGKSTIALHRVSYLLYNYKNLQAPRVAIIAPNRLFLDYISAVLPGLELEEIKQFTFTELCRSVLGLQSVTVNLLAEGVPDTAVQAAPGSLAFKTLLDDYVQQKQAEFSDSLADISMYDGYLLVTRAELRQKFTEGNNPYNRRIASLRKYLEFRINYFLETSDSPLSGKPSAKQPIKGYLQRVREKYGQAGRRQLQDALLAITREREELIQTLMLTWRPLSVDAVFAGVTGVSGISGENIARLSRSSLAGLCYVKHLLDGFEHKFQHLVVDEAQDMSPLEFVVLKLMCHNSFTILGDLAQAITPDAGIDNWQLLATEVFSPHQAEFFELTQSYRSTREIVKFANQVIPVGLPRGVPVYRSGEVPGIEWMADWEHTVLRCRELIAAYRAKGCQTMAIICKAASEAECVFHALAAELGEPRDLHLIAAASTRYEGGLSVVPIVLAKGLEFDAVIVWNASRERFTPTALDAKLLFVALSRPLHYLHVLFTGELTPHLQV
ncbi:MAG: AAA family ATPase [Peptococcaceae bacterium]|nr:AAA family ATPase [Peptococcaceae bacterium]